MQGDTTNQYECRGARLVRADSQASASMLVLSGHTMLAGVILSDYATLMIEVLKDNARPEANAVYGAIEMDWAKLVGQIARTHGE